MLKDFVSLQAKRDFERDGFVLVPSMYSAEEICELGAWVDDLVARGPQTGAPERFYLENNLLSQNSDRILNRVEKFSEGQAAVHKFIYGDKMTQMVQTLLGERGVLFKEKINFKLPGGDGFKPHQDIQPGWDVYAQYFLSVLVTIDQSVEANGCLELVRGAHKRGMLGRMWKPLEGDELKGLYFEKYELDPGDVVFFDCFVPHQSKANLTSQRRRNLYLTYNRLSEGDQRERYFADKLLNYPPDNARIPGKQYVFQV